nr:unnamed protein product [Callosobruchus chinensis]
MLSAVSRRLKPSEVSRSGFASESGDDKNKEPNIPVICTEVPGPNTAKLIRDLRPFQNTEGVNVFADYEASIGNFMTDVDGNSFLDLNMQLDTMPLGYNHPAVLRIFEDPKKIKNIVNRPVSGVYPGDYWAEKIKTIVNKVEAFVDYLRCKRLDRFSHQPALSLKYE